jgi:hypothetical protein
LICYIKPQGGAHFWQIKNKVVLTPGIAMLAGKGSIQKPPGVLQHRAADLIIFFYF